MESSPGGSGGSNGLEFGQPVSYIPPSMQQSTSRISGKSSSGLSKGVISNNGNENSKKSFAAAATGTRYIEKESDVNSLFSTEQKWRSYQLKGQLPLGFNKYIEEKFKSCNFFTFMKYKRKTGGDLCAVLKLGFDMTKDSGEADYNSSIQLKTKIGETEITLDSIDKQQLDKNGTLIPRSSKAFILRGLTHELVQNNDLIKSKLEKYADFGENFTIKPIKEGPNLMFKGKAIIKVNKFINERPPREINFPVYYFDPTNDTLVADPEGTTVPIRVAVTGCELEKVAPEPKREEFLCHGCGKPGHIKRFCPERKFFCNTCEGYNTGCSVGNCLNEENIRNGIFLSRHERTKNIREDKQKDLEQRRKIEEDNMRKETARSILKIQNDKSKRAGKTMTQADVERENKASQSLLLAKMLLDVGKGNNTDWTDEDPDPNNNNIWQNVTDRRRRSKTNNRYGTIPEQVEETVNPLDQSVMIVENKNSNEDLEDYDAMCQRLEQERLEKEKKREELMAEKERKLHDQNTPDLMEEENDNNDDDDESL